MTAIDAEETAVVGTAGGVGAISEIVVAVTMIISAEMGVTVITGTAAGGGTIAGTRAEVTMEVMTETEIEATEAEEVATTEGVVMILGEEGAVVEV